MKLRSQVWLAFLTAAFVLACQDSSSPTEPQKLEMASQAQAGTETVARARVTVNIPRPGTSTIPARGENLSGTYLLTATESCDGVTSSFPVNVVQTGSSIGWLLGIDTGGVQGTILEDTVSLVWQKESDAGLLCGSQLTGTATIKGGMIAGQASGNSNGHSCFSCASDTVSFTLVRQ